MIHYLNPALTLWRGLAKWIQLWFLRLLSRHKNTTVLQRVSIPKIYIYCLHDSWPIFSRSYHVLSILLLIFANIDPRNLTTWLYRWKAKTQVATVAMCTPCYSESTVLSKTKQNYLPFPGCNGMWWNVSKPSLGWHQIFSQTFGRIHTLHHESSCRSSNVQATFKQQAKLTHHSCL